MTIPDDTVTVFALADAFPRLAEDEARWQADVAVWAESAMNKRDVATARMLQLITKYL